MWGTWLVGESWESEGVTFLGGGFSYALVVVRSVVVILGRGRLVISEGTKGFGVESGRWVLGLVGKTSLGVVNIGAGEGVVDISVVGEGGGEEVVVVVVVVVVVEVVVVGRSSAVDKM